MNQEHANGRRDYSPEDKVKILRVHLLDGRTISEVCERSRIHPTQFYHWQKTYFENRAAVFTKLRLSRL